MPLSTVNGGGFDNSINCGIIDSSYSFSGFSLQYLYHSGNIRYVYNTGFGLIDAKLSSGSGVNLNSYPFYKIIPSGNVSVNQLQYVDSNPVYQVYSYNSGIVYFTNTGNITLSTQFGSTQSLYVTPTINTIAPPVIISGFPFNPADHLLFCYNANSQDSIDLKNYYFQTRPELSNANVLGLNCNRAFSGELTDVLDYNNNIRDPIINYLNNSNKPIRYITLLYDIGVRLTGYSDSNPYALTTVLPEQYPSPQYNTGLSYVDFISTYIVSGDQIGHMTVSTSLIPYFRFRNRQNLSISDIRNNSTKKYTNDGVYNRNLLFENGSTQSLNFPFDNSHKPWKRYSVSEFPYTIMVTHITARNKQDVSGYIKKIGEAELYNNYYRRGNKPNKNFYLFESAIENNSGEVSIQAANNSGLYVGVIASILTGANSGISVKTCYPNYSLNGFASDYDWIRSPMVSGKDVAGLFHNGVHTTDVVAPQNLSQYMRAAYSYNNQAKLTGNNWYLLTTAESFNGCNFVNYGGTTPLNIIPQDQDFDGGQGTMFSWLRSGAFGGTGYENCPVGILGHPTEMGMSISVSTLFSTWFSGLSFIECAELSNLYPSSYSIAFGPYKIGDPLIVL